MRSGNSSSIHLREARSSPFPFVTVLVIALNVVMYWYEVTLNEARLDLFLRQWGVVPDQILGALSGQTTQASILLTPLTSMFLHVHGIHLATNMLYLAVFGAPAERTLGHTRFALFYACCGIAAALVQVVTSSASLSPAVGASGAIAGLLAASLILRPSSTIAAIAPRLFYFPRVDVAAVTMLALWGISQVLAAVAVFNSSESGSGGAWVAHLGGFVAGFALIFAFRPRRARPYHW